MRAGIDYAVATGLTAVGDDLVAVLAGLPTDPVGLCGAAQGLVVLPDLAAGLDLPAHRLDERSIRPASAIIRTLLALDERPLERPRPLPDRIVGTCRHFAVLSCAFLRFRGIRARARCGFAGYFVPGDFVDHWVVEYWHDDERRWVRVDPEILGFEFVAAPDDLAPGEFLTGGEAWTACRSGEIDPARFGVHGVPDNWGIAEVRGNAVRDLAALNKVEMLPWDEWGRMHASYEGQTGDDYDELIDVVARVCAAGDEAEIASLYASDDLAVPASMSGVGAGAGEGAEP